MLFIACGFFFKQKTAYDMRISDWSSDVCSSDLAIGLTVLPPDVNASNFMFEAIDEATIRYGLGAVKGVGRGACEAIADERGRDGTFEDLLDFCRRIESSQLNRRTDRKSPRLHSSH